MSDKFLVQEQYLTWWVPFELFFEFFFHSSLEINFQTEEWINIEYDEEE